jgi:hypothetical protein
MAVGAVIWVIGVVLLGGAALLLPALTAHRRRNPQRPPQRPPAGPPAQAVTAERYEIVVDDDGLTVRVRGYGYATDWAQRCRLCWDEVVSLVLDTGAYDSIVSLYATTRGDHFHTHLVDGSAFSRDQWTSLRAVIAARTGGRIDLDLGPLDGRA